MGFVLIAHTHPDAELELSHWFEPTLYRRNRENLNYLLIFREILIRVISRIENLQSLLTMRSENPYAFVNIVHNTQNQCGINKFPLTNAISFNGSPENINKHKNYLQ